MVHLFNARRTISDSSLCLYVSVSASSIVVSASVVATAAWSVILKGGFLKIASYVANASLVWHQKEPRSKTVA